MPPNDLLILFGAVALAITTIIVVRLRVRSHGRETADLAERTVCDHLRPALDLLLSRGHRVRRVGQKNPEMPLEIHVTPAFDPSALYDELKLAEPVFVSDRNVLYCKEDWCEIQPVKA